MPGVDREHTTHYESCGCAEAKGERLEARVAELEAALRDISRRTRRGDPLGEIADAALKGDAE